MRKIFSAIILFLMLLGINAQNKPAFWDDIQHFKHFNKENPPPKNAVLLVGSSSFTMWKDVDAYFPDKVIVNRGFGGSSLYDLNFYSEELLKPYSPKQIIIYCGENDFAGNEKLKPREVFNRFKHFYAEIRKYYPEIPVAYVSIKLSPSRENLWPQFIATNSLIKKFMDRKENAEYIDITKAMNGPDGKIRKDLFLEDMLHMKPEGYQIWKKVMEPYLK
ncbi:MAG: GDSL-type esterase/lipase family protein [Weeksellaceae bacterium]|nr:G-D-S-L family lipolytic protein [Bacteroidota bacterium]MCG2780543.1 GDSL-type esterase/lipase family protein [Weeksellaceae bacterium]